MGRGSRRSGRWFGYKDVEQFDQLDYTLPSRQRDLSDRGAASAKTIRSKQNKSLAAAKRKPSMPKLNLPEPED